MSRTNWGFALIVVAGCGEILPSGGDDDEQADAGPGGDAGTAGGECVPTSGERLRRVRLVFAPELRSRLREALAAEA